MWGASLRCLSPVGTRGCGIRRGLWKQGWDSQVLFQVQILTCAKEL